MNIASNASRGRPFPCALVVEPPASARAGLAKMLKGEGVSVIACADSAQTVSLARQHRPDVVLLDLDTPGVEDVEQWVTALEAMTTVVLVCPRDVDEARLVALEASGALLVLVKPLPSEWLMHALHHAIAESRGSRGPRPVAA